LSWDLKTPFVKNFTLQGIQLLYNEVSAGQDSYALGGQVSASCSTALTATPSILSMKFNRPDGILAASAFAVQATTTGAGALLRRPFPTPGEGPGCAVANGSSRFAPCIFAPNGMTNAVTIGANGVAHFRSEFNYFDVILNTRSRRDTSVSRSTSCLNSNRTLAPRITRSVPVELLLTGLGKQDHAYLVDASVGQQRNKGDLQVGYHGDVRNRNL